MLRFNLLSAVILILMTWLFTAPFSQADPGIVVIPTDYDFGEVELGSSKSTDITITNEWWGSLTINAVSFQTGSSPDFSFTSPPPSGTVISPGASVFMGITYTPSDVGYAEAIVEIDWSNGESGTSLVLLSGTGVESQPPPVTIEDIIAFFDEFFANGSLVGNGPGKSAEHRLNALRNMLVETSRLIDGSDYEGACDQLLSAYKHCDGQSNPPDFVQGASQNDLAQKILELIEDLECMGCLDKSIAPFSEYRKSIMSEKILLQQNIPNPFNPSTKIIYSVPQLTNVVIKVFNILGYEIKTLVNEEKPAGTYKVTWDAENFPSGVYFYQLKAGNPESSSGQVFIDTKKMLLLK